MRLAFFLSMIAFIVISGIVVAADDGTVDTFPEEIISEIDGATMHLIPAGEFEMGDHFKGGVDDEHPVHTVFVDAFYMDVTEVTNAMYAKFLNAMGKHVGDTANVWLDIGSGFELIEWVGTPPMSSLNKKKAPHCCGARAINMPSLSCPT